MAPPRPGGTALLITVKPLRQVSMSALRLAWVGSSRDDGLTAVGGATSSAVAQRSPSAAGGKADQPHGADGASAKQPEEISVYALFGISQFHNVAISQFHNFEKIL